MRQTHNNLSRNDWSSRPVITHSHISRLSRKHSRENFIAGSEPASHPRENDDHDRDRLVSVRITHIHVKFRDRDLSANMCLWVADGKLHLWDLRGSSKRNSRDENACLLLFFLFFFFWEDGFWCGVRSIFVFEQHIRNRFLNGVQKWHTHIRVTLATRKDRENSCWVLRLVE